MPTLAGCHDVKCGIGEREILSSPKTILDAYSGVAIKLCCLLKKRGGNIKSADDSALLGNPSCDCSSTCAEVKNPLSCKSDANPFERPKELVWKSRAMLSIVPSNLAKINIHATYHRGEMNDLCRSTVVLQPSETEKMGDNLVQSMH